MIDTCSHVITDLVCDANYTDAILLCKICLNGCDADTIECSTYELKECFYRRALGVWATFIIVVGILGNMLTLLAVPYAARKKRLYPVT